MHIRFDADAADVTASDLVFDDDPEELDGPPEPSETPQARARPSPSRRGPAQPRAPGKSPSRG